MLLKSVERRLKAINRFGAKIGPFLVFVVQLEARASSGHAGPRFWAFCCWAFCSWILVSGVLVLGVASPGRC